MFSPALPRDFSLIDFQRLGPGRYAFLLEAVADSKALPRWDFLFLEKGEGLICHADGQTKNLCGERVAGMFLEALDAVWKNSANDEDDSDIPFRGGWALFLSYELAGQIESRLKLPLSDGPLPMALALRCPSSGVAEKKYRRSLSDSGTR